MQVKDFRGFSYPWPPKYHEPTDDDARCRSAPHIKARRLLRTLFPAYTILEEVPLPGINLTADFFIPIQNKIVEVHGEQHYKYVSHFHGTYLGFARSRANDRKKREWCELNNLEYIELPYNESEYEWEARIFGSTR